MCRTLRVSSGSAASTSTPIRRLTLSCEIDLTNASQPKFPIYAALGVPEIWRYDGSQAYFYHLAGAQYVETSHSQAFPFLTGAILAQFIEQSKTEGQVCCLGRCPCMGASQ